MKNKQYPTVRYVAERLVAISRQLRIDCYTSDRFTRAEKFHIGCMIEELLSHSKTLLHYAHDFPITERNYPCTVEDILDSDYLPF